MSVLNDPSKRTESFGTEWNLFFQTSLSLNIGKMPTHLCGPHLDTQRLQIYDSAEGTKNGLHMYEEAGHLLNKHLDHHGQWPLVCVS